MMRVSQDAYKNMGSETDLSTEFLEILRFPVQYFIQNAVHQVHHHTGPPPTA